MLPSGGYYELYVGSIFPQNIISKENYFFINVHRQRKTSIHLHLYSVAAVEGG